MRLREFAPAGGGGSGDYFQALASAWYNGTFDTGSLQKGIKSQQDVERLLNRGIVCPDGKTRKLHIDYNSDFDGVEIYSDDYYEYGDHDDTIDSRTGQKWGPYDFMAFSDEDLSEGLTEFAADGESGRWYTDDQMTDLVGDGWWQDMDISGANIGVLDAEVPKKYMIQQAQHWLKRQGHNVQVLNVRVNDDDCEWYIEGTFPKDLTEFAPDSNDGGGEDDALHKYARMWWAGDEATQMQIERALAKMGWEIGEDEGGYDNGGVFVVRAGDENGNSYQSWAAEDLTEGLTEVDRRGFLKGLGAAAVAGAAGGAKADRSWNQDEFSKQWVGNMTSETFPGAILGWKDEDKEFFLNLREPTNYSPNNVRDKRLYYPKITSPQFKIKFGDEPPISGVGSVFTFPLRQLGDYAGSGMTIARGATFSKWRDSFVNADKVVMRLEIDGQPTTVVFYDNPAAVQQRNQQKAELEKQRAEQEKQSQKKKELDTDNAKIRATIRQQAIDEVIDQNGPIIPAIAMAISLPKGSPESKIIISCLNFFTKFMPGIPEHYQNIQKDMSDQNSVLGVSRQQWIAGAPSMIKKLTDYKAKIEELSVKESVNQGMAEGNNPWGPEGRFVGDTGPTQVSTTVPRVQLRIGDRVLYKPTEQRATIEALSKDGTKARIHIPSPMGGRIFNCQTADLKALGPGLIREKSTSQAQFRTMAAAAHDPKFAKKVGIKQSVAREFNKADKGQSYKSLPKKA